MEIVVGSWVDSLWVGIMTERVGGGSLGRKGRKRARKGRNIMKIDAGDWKD